MTENFIDYSSMALGEENEVYSLVTKVFDTHVAPYYSLGGRKKFLGLLSPPGLREMAEGEDSFVIVAKDNNKLVGMVAVINASHIALLFVNTKHQGKAIGTDLISHASEIALKRKPEINELTVSSSPNSESFYAHAGFVKEGSEVNEGGMRFTPMKKSLN